MLRLNEKLSEVQLLRLRASFHALPLSYLQTQSLHTYARKNCATFQINPKGSSAQNSPAEHFRPSQHSLETRLQSSKENKASKCSSWWLAKRTAVVCEMIISASDSPSYNEEIILTQSWVQYENYLQQVRCSGWPRPRTAKITKVQVEQPSKEIIKWELDCVAIRRLKTLYDQRSIHPLYIWVSSFRL